MIRVAWHPSYEHPLPEGHRFPMEKYGLLPEQLLYEGTLQSGHFFTPGLLEKQVAVLAHTPTYWEKLLGLSLSRQEERKTGFPLSDALVARERRIMQGTLEAALYALEGGAALNIAGGTHHAYTDFGSGFCLLNDNAIAASYLLHRHLVQRILIIDLDVHQGDGTAQIFRHEPRVFTFSMHGAANFPMHKQESDWDIPLPDGTTDATYLKLLREALPQMYARHQPDFVFFQSGVDVLERDALGRLSLTIDGCRERDRLVFAFCKENNLPVVASMGGGYSKFLSDIIEAHANTYRLAVDFFA